MSPTIARTLKRYAIAVVPAVVQRRYPGMSYRLTRWLKRWWVREMSHRERAVFRRIAERGGPLPDKFKKLARGVGLIVQWPPPPKQKPKPRRWGKPKSWRTKAYGRRRF